MSELKPCPFCGGDDIRCSFKVSGHFVKQYRVAMFCNDCHTYGPRVLTIKKEHDDYKGRDAITKDEKYEAEAIEAWNRRTEDANTVVRCKNCLFYDETIGKDSGKPCGYGSCRVPSHITGIVYDEDFCSYGERISHG